MCNEDANVGAQAAKAAELSGAGGTLWGQELHELNQSLPFMFNGAANDRLCEVEGSYGTMKKWPYR